MSDRREQILEAALLLANESGPGALSVRAVAERAGIGASTLRYYFPAQSDLAFAVSERMMLRTVPDLNIEDSSLPPHRRLAECAMQFLPPSSDEAPYQVSAWAEQIGAGFGLNAGEASRRLLERLYRLGIGRFEAWLGVLAAEGYVDEGEVAEAASILSAACDGFMLQLAAGEADLEQVRERLEALCILIVHGEH